MYGRLALGFALLFGMRETMSSAIVGCNPKIERRDNRARHETGVVAGIARMLQPRSRARAKKELENGLTSVSRHRDDAIVPSRDDVRGPSPDDGRTTNRGRATRDGRPSRHSTVANPGWRLPT